MTVQTHPGDTALRNDYRLPGTIPEFEVEIGKTALVIIDMQYADAHRSGDFGRRAIEQGIEDKVEWFFSRLEETTVPAIRRLLECARNYDMDVIFTRIAAQTSDGRDSGWRYRMWGLTALETHRDSQILDEITPRGDELIITKTATSAFIGSNLDHTLRNLGIQYLVICGVATGGCVESTVRDAADHGYRVMVVDDACAAISENAHANSVNAMSHIFARVKDADEIIAQLEKQLSL